MKVLRGKRSAPVVHLHLFAVQRWPGRASVDGRSRFAPGSVRRVCGFPSGNRALGGEGGSASARLGGGWPFRSRWSAVPPRAGSLDVIKLCRVPGRSGGLRTSSVCLFRGARRAFPERGCHSRGSGKTRCPCGFDLRSSAVRVPHYNFHLGNPQTKTKPKKVKFWAKDADTKNGS